MKMTSVINLICAAIATFVISWLLVATLEDSGTSVSVPWMTWGVLVGLTTTVLVLGWPVRQWNSPDRRRHVHALRAARTLAWARASSRAGAVFLGWFAGMAVALLPSVAIESVQDRIIGAVVAALLSGSLAVAGYLVESWCRIDPKDDDFGQSQPAES